MNVFVALYWLRTLSAAALVVGAVLTAVGVTTIVRARRSS